jgi:hypothetical protein
VHVEKFFARGTRAAVVRIPGFATSQFAAIQAVAPSLRVEFAARYGLPAVYPFRGYVAAGGLQDAFGKWYTAYTRFWR